MNGTGTMVADPGDTRTGEMALKMTMNDDDDEPLDDKALEWLSKRNQAWFDDKGQHGMYYINHHEGKIYFYKNRDDYPSNPAIWFPGETIGTWSPNSNTFMWSCDNDTSVESSTAISKDGKKMFGFTAKFVPNVKSIDLAWRLVAVAAMTSNVIAVYNASCKYNDVKNELKAIGKKVPDYMKNQIYNYEFFAITGEENVVPSINPNCSEVVLHIGGMTSESVIKELESIGVDPGIFRFTDDPFISSVGIGVMSDCLSNDQREVKAMLAVENHFGGTWEENTGSLEFYKEWGRQNVRELIPNCSEVVFELTGMTRDDAVAKLREIGIFEVTIPRDDNGNERPWTVLADKDNLLIPNASPYAGNFDIDEWASGIVVHGGMNLEDYAYPTMLKIQKAFPKGSWDDINGTEAGAFLQWYIHGTTPIKTPMDNRTKELREKHVEPALRKMIDPNPKLA
jgi:hypothetical protein